MRYLLMICTDEAADATDDADRTEMSADYAAFNKTMAERGVLRDGARLRPTTDATTVRVRNDDLLTTDGPFAETKEQVGGYYVVDCRDLDEAIEVASKIPAAKHGSIEVRPIWEMG